MDKNKDDPAREWLTKWRALELQDLARTLRHHGVVGSAELAPNDESRNGQIPRAFVDEKSRSAVLFIGDLVLSSKLVFPQAKRDGEPVRGAAERCVVAVSRAGTAILELLDEVRALASEIRALEARLLTEKALREEQGQQVAILEGALAEAVGIDRGDGPDRSATAVACRRARFLDLLAAACGPIEDDDCTGERPPLVFVPADDGEGFAVVHVDSGLAIGDAAGEFIWLDEADAARVAAYAQPPADSSSFWSGMPLDDVLDYVDDADMDCDAGRDGDCVGTATR